MEAVETVTIEAVSVSKEDVQDNTEKDDSIEIVTLNDTEKAQKPELDRAATTVIHSSQQSDKDTNYDNNTTNIKKRDDEKKNQKELSSIPYSLERLHNKTIMLDLLRSTKLRDLFAVSYVFRYIVCVIIGCLSFLSLVFLWKVAFRINTCRIEGEDRQFKYMPFAFGFMVAYKNGLLIFAPLLYVLLPTVGVIRKHRTRFILAYLLIVFATFSCYGLYAYNWSRYSNISTAALGVLALIIFFYWGGYFAFWVIFPFFSAAAVALIIMGVMREYVWSLVHSKPILFGIIYPMYLTILQTITYKCMLWFRLPYKIRQFFTNICPYCCCQTAENGQTPVYYDNYDNFWSTELKYVETTELDKNNKNRIEAEHENTETQVIHKTNSKTSHRYKSTELQLSVEDVWSNDILFVAGGTVIVLMESMRVAGMIELKDDIGALVLNILMSIVLECATRNNLYGEFIYKVCLKKENPALTRFYSSVFGTRYQAEYIPYVVIAMMNLTYFGPTNKCIIKQQMDLGDTISLAVDKYWWFYIVLFASEILSDLFADLIKKQGRKRGLFGNKDGDPAREATYVKLKPWMMVCVFISFFAISYRAYEIDYDARMRH